jgi:formamidopyrimidine-DNA glycosylase
MPELPEVETTRRGILPHVQGARVAQVIVRNARLRWKVEPGLKRELPGQVVRSVERRAKYLLLRCDTATLILHLGMSGSLRVLDKTTPPAKHDHLDIVFDSGLCLRLRDPRRFGAALWTRGDPARHPLLENLGPEPLSDEFNGNALYRHTRSRRAAIKQLLMNNRVVAGVGNIYANEALFLAGVHPLRAAGKLSRARCARLAQAVKQVLREAIARGGTTLRDFRQSDGAPGYFAQQLKVYSRAGEACPRCATALQHQRQGQRASYYCARCQH